MTRSLLRRVSVRWCLLFALLASLVGVPQAASAQSNARYFSETGHYLRGAFRAFWEANGGLLVFGFPLTEEYRRSADGKIVQYTERARFELAANGSVELGLLGREATGNRIFPIVPPFAVPAGSRYFPETRNTLKGLFRQTWETRNGLRIFGLPISEEIYEQFPDGQYRIVQYFQRTRFELWPDGVKFGRLGADLAPLQLLLPWPPDIQPPGPLNEDGTPRPPVAPIGPFGGRAQVRVNPIAGRPGDEFRITGEAFQPGERVIFWLTSPSSEVFPLGDVATADGNGSIRNANIGFDTGRRDQEGIWYATAQGLTSGRIGSGAFRLDGDVQVSPNAPTGTADVRVTPESGGVGTTFRLLGSGFRERENVSVWLTAPDGSVRAVSTSVRANRDGVISDSNVQFVVGAGAVAGRWSVTAQGQESGLQGIASFAVGGVGTGTGAPPPPSSGTPPPPFPPNLRNVIHPALGITNGTSPITPLAAAPGQPFRAVVGGFGGGERIIITLTAPNGQTSGIDQDVRADGGGTWSVTFTPPGVTGDWTMQARGEITGVQRTQRFKVTTDYIAPPGTTPPPARNGSVTPTSAGRGATFQISGFGFRPNEVIDHWITSPDGLYYLVGRTQADGNGRIGFAPSLSVQFGDRNPAGVYGYNYLGTVSGNRVELYINLTP